MVADGGVGAVNGTCGSKCNLTEHEWIFILATGRSGSTTMLEMVDSLPGVKLMGEHDGVLKSFKDLRDRLRITRKYGALAAWQQAQDELSDSEVYCMAQRWIFYHSGASCGSRVIRGFKEIRYNDEDILDFIVAAFPKARFVICYRNDIHAQAHSAWHKKNKNAKEKLIAETMSLVRWAGARPERAFAFPLEHYDASNFTKLFHWLGFPHCMANSVIHLNSNGGYTSVESGAKQKAQGVVSCDQVPMTPLPPSIEGGKGKVAVSSSAAARDTSKAEVQQAGSPGSTKFANATDKAVSWHVRGSAGASSTRSGGVGPPESNIVTQRKLKSLKLNDENQHFLKGNVPNSRSSSSSQCLGCNINEHQWIFVLGTGRSGSTTVLEMINALPGVELSGEHDGLMRSFKDFKEHVDVTRNHKSDAWKHDSAELGDLEVYCLVQRWFFLHTGRQCGSTMIHGFKEIRYTSPDILDFLLEAFPRARIVVNFRLDKKKQADSGWFASSTPKASQAAIEGMTRSLLEWAESRGKDKVFLLPLEHFSVGNFSRLYSWLGFEHCRATGVVHANQGSGGKKSGGGFDAATLPSLADNSSRGGGILECRLEEHAPAVQ